MKRIAPLAIACLLAAHSVDARSETPPRPAAAEREGRDRPGRLLELGPEAARRAGLELTRATASELAPEVLGYGRVLDPAPVVAAVGRWQTARAQAERADEELRRTEVLARDEQNASTRDLEVARATDRSARAERDVAEAQVVGLLGFRAANGPGLASLVRGLAQRSSGLIRVDVPAASERPAPERGWWLVAHPGPAQPLAAEYLGPAPDANPQAPGWGFLFVVAEDPPPPGTPIRARIRTDRDPRQGVDVPSEALVRDGGEVFVFVQRGEGTFERLPVVARARGDGRWFVEGDVEPGTEIVVSGAQQLLSAQRLGPNAASGD